MTIENSLKVAFSKDESVEVLHLHEIGSDYRKKIEVIIFSLRIVLKRD